MKEITLEVSKRSDTGKGVARKLRAAKRIPAVAYGKQSEPMPLDIEYDHFHQTMHALHGENALINLTIDGQSVADKALIRDIQHDPVYGDILHIDFQYIKTNEKIRMSVPVKLTGTSIGVKNYSGVLQWKHRDLELLAMPNDIPEYVEINIEDLNIGDAVHASDLDYPNVEFIVTEAETIVSVIAPKVTKLSTTAVEGEEGAEVAEAPAEGESQEPEVISEKKAEERQSGKE